jgi:hypothetical protein
VENDAVEELLLLFALNAAVRAWKARTACAEAKRARDNDVAATDARAEEEKAEEDDAAVKKGAEREEAEEEAELAVDEAAVKLEKCACVVLIDAAAAAEPADREKVRGSCRDEDEEGAVAALTSAATSFRNNVFCRSVLNARRASTCALVRKGLVAGVALAQCAETDVGPAAPGRTDAVVAAAAAGLADARLNACIFVLRVVRVRAVRDGCCCCCWLAGHSGSGCASGALPRRQVEAEGSWSGAARRGAGASRRRGTQLQCESSLCAATRAPGGVGLGLWHAVLRRLNLTVPCDATPRGALV